MLVATVEATDRKFGEQTYEIYMIHEFGIPRGEFIDAAKFKKKIADMYMESSKHDVLFSDFTQGNLESFVTLFLNPRSVWFEIRRTRDQKIIGAAYATDVILQYDADAHFTVWDSIGAGREPIFTEIMRYVMQRYNLKRISAWIPAYQRGAIRMIRRLGFTEEGRKRDAILHKEGEWIESILFGILWEELNDERWRAKRNAGRDAGLSGVRWNDISGSVRGSADAESPVVRTEGSINASRV